MKKLLLSLILFTTALTQSSSAIPLPEEDKAAESDKAAPKAEVEKAPAPAKEAPAEKKETEKKVIQPAPKPKPKPKRVVPDNVGDLLDKVIPTLVNNKGEKIDYKDLKDKEYIVFYWSALWCGPCRRFSPKLKEVYKKFGGGKRFEVIFVSSDRSEDKMKHYMKRN